nr:ATP-binding protein [Euryarchaeota archaeon]
APQTRTVHGRSVEFTQLNKWYESRKPSLVVSGIAGCGKTTLVSHWLNARIDSEPNLRVMYYPCQPWDTEIGIATSILHRLGIESKGSLQWDPYKILESLPMNAGGKFDVDMYRRRLTAYLTDPEKLREKVFEKLEDKSETPPYILLVIDDVHNVENDSSHLLGALLQIADQTPLRTLLISRTSLSFYDRRDVHTRGLVEELPLRGLTIEEVEEWIDKFESPSPPVAEEVHRVTGGHPLAVELLEMYGDVVHGDWLRFLDEEIIDVIPADHRELLALLAVAEQPVEWAILADLAGLEGTPPEDLISRGIIVELADGLWLHEAMRERLLREVGPSMDERRITLSDAMS